MHLEIITKTMNYKPADGKRESFENLISGYLQFRDYF